ncbi:hypothetical protein M441DRAFT_389564 [Trichoderma asperellum CBS 433.97]|uniref:Uncharacterized protein n=1 Tax=Trichoderma asperellum (strain ATCC 204424 / CBS 433.97 / NBRC 101777) TaxID=1042311 RepID=A0A2T3ZC71_TRIA4|nr:hypothetical protein M441DRAFT_389564 [Trichoderma asperellum CBS 433.97]PTB42399.1 hypothetical protein M441DRAFT_389564 [Trichoderma asperellum CBS 433.97]WVH32610.1 hypothetical protein [Trichoderma asperellum]
MSWAAIRQRKLVEFPWRSCHGYESTNLGSGQRSRPQALLWHPICPLSLVLVSYYAHPPLTKAYFVEVKSQGGRALLCSAPRTTCESVNIHFRNQCSDIDSSQTLDLRCLGWNS